MAGSHLGQLTCKSCCQPHCLAPQRWQQLLPLCLRKERAASQPPLPALACAAHRKHLPPPPQQLVAHGRWHLQQQERGKSLSLLLALLSQGACDAGRKQAPPPLGPAREAALRASRVSSLSGLPMQSCHALPVEAPNSRALQPGDDEKSKNTVSADEALRSEQAEGFCCAHNKDQVPTASLNPELSKVCCAPRLQRA